ncbi:D-alanyl-D-alanine carboxypeptidase/D-alanyl-D-alanine endopeptidase [Actinoplanes sichuanensis]|uniref:D-alanyl-D-alanine carboxypeptidase/D-alanyl-D-alanine-endopeptidase n=1 Tax=Actinoplanes sichuanensis TaxID=512349 RepID=A0ABW4AML6_9ACTN|nr:D-alanyl-D-alanine carboxypeptidase/D-alanyl-D-alanine-endopeptidase [Actinoplanes sichuanensis]
MDRTVSLQRPVDPDRTINLGSAGTAAQRAGQPDTGTAGTNAAGPSPAKGSAPAGGPVAKGAAPVSAPPSKGSAQVTGPTTARAAAPGRAAVAGSAAAGGAGSAAKAAAKAAVPGVGPVGAVEAGRYGRASVAPSTARASVPLAPPPAAPGDEVAPAEVKTGRGSRTKLVVGVLVLAVLAAAVGIVVRPGPVDGWLDALTGEPARTTPAPAPTTPEPTPTPVLVAAEADGSVPDVAAVKVALDPLVNAKALGPTVHIQVLDVASDTILYERNPTKATTPASTTKVLTAASVLAARGAAYRLETRVVAGSAPGEVVIVGGGDATLAVFEDDKDLFPGAARLDDLAAQVKKALGGVKPTRVLVDTTLFEGPETAPGWDTWDVSPGGQVARIQSLMTNAGRIEPVHNEFGGDPRFADPALSAGKLFAKMIAAPQGSVKRGTAPADASPPVEAGGTWTPGAELGRVQSPPLVQVVDWMLQQSDNVLAEVLGRQVALAAGKEASFAGAAEAMAEKLAELGLPADQAKLYDASGLSNRNGITPELLVETLELAAEGSQPALGNIFNGLPVAGWSGTLETRFATPSDNATAQGVVRAKTGSLSGVNTLAGVLVTRDRRVLAFAIMAKGGPDATAARAAIDRVAARLVDCGC